MTIHDIASFLQKIGMSDGEVTPILDRLTKDGLTEENRQLLLEIIDQRMSTENLTAQKNPAGILLAECKRQLDSIVATTTEQMAQVTQLAQRDLLALAYQPITTGQR